MLSIVADMGVSGDMFLGALWDLGLVPEDDVLDSMQTLTRTSSAGLIQGERVVKAGVNAFHVHVDARETGWSSSWVEERIKSSCDSLLLEEGRDFALEAFMRLVDAEREVHGISPEDYPHLHEAGSPDTVVDMVGAGYFYEKSKIMDMEVVGGPVSLGGGRAKIAHGWVSVPAPATRKILEGYPCRTGPVDGELATPTGAAILRTLVTRTENDMTPFMEGRSGIGAGSLDFPHNSNVLRVFYTEDR